MYSRVQVRCTLEYVLPGCGVLYSTPYPGMAYCIVCPTRVGRTLEYVVTVVSMDARVQKLPRVRGGSYTRSGRPAFSPALYQVNSARAKILASFPFQVKIREGQAKET